MKKTSVIILAAGKGKRMKSSLPKVLHEIGGKPLILHIVDKCKQLKLQNIFVVLSKDSNDIKKILPSNIKIIEQEKQLGTANALSCAKKQLKNYTGQILVLYGDVPFIEVNSLRKIIKNTQKIPCLIGFETKKPKGYGRILIERNQIKRVVEEKNATIQIKKILLCNSGIFCSPSKLLFKLIEKIKINHIAKEYLLTDIFEIAFSDGVGSTILKLKEEEVAGINDKLQLSKAENKYQSILREKFLKKGVTLNSPQTVIFSYDTKISRDVQIGSFCHFGKKVVIKSGVKIGNNCSIEDSIICEEAVLGPFSRLRNNNYVGKKSKIGNFVELKKTYIGSNSKVNHLAYIGDAFIGSNTNIGAGTITCNYDGKKKNVSKIGNNVFIGSNCSIIAPIKIANDCFVAAGSTISKNLLNKDFSIARARQKIVRKGRDKFLK